MKRYLVFVLSVLLLLCTTACSGPKLSIEEKINIADAAWNEMSAGVTSIAKAANVIDTCWQAGTKYAGKSDTSVSSICNNLGIYDNDTIVAAMKAVSIDGGLSLSECVQTGVFLCDYLGLYADAKLHIDNAQDTFKDLEHDSRMYELFRDYSIAASSYLQYLESPTGSYSDFANKTNDFADAISEYGNSLAFEMKNIE